MITHDRNDPNLMHGLLGNAVYMHGAWRMVEDHAWFEDTQGRARCRCDWRAIRTRGE